MTNIMVCGCLGRLGTSIDRVAATMEDVKIIAGTDAFDGVRSYPIYKNITECKQKPDVIINVLRPTDTEEILQLLAYCTENRVPLIVCTTSLPPEVETAIAETSKKVAILKSANMSLGINLLTSLLNRAAKMLYDSNFDIEIIEKHHSKKLDAPSGTAYMLADSINQALGGDRE